MGASRIVVRLAASMALAWLGFCAGCVARQAEPAPLVGRDASRPMASDRPADAHASDSASPSAPEGSPQAPLAGPRIVVRKAEHALEVYDGEALVKIYPVGLGMASDGASTAEAGPKARQGDRKTPEGLYHIRDRHDAGRFYHWMALDYPNAEDAERGLRDGLIGKREYDRIAQALEAGGLPPMDTKLGGDVGIHGGGSGTDWTLGCIAVENAHADELWALAPVGTPVEILP